MNSASFRAGVIRTYLSGNAITKFNNEGANKKEAEAAPHSLPNGVLKLSGEDRLSGEYWNPQKT